MHAARSHFRRLVVLASLAGLAACQPAPPPPEPALFGATRHQMGTLIAMQVLVTGNDGEAQRQLAAGFDEITRLERLMGYGPESEVLRMNDAAGRSPSPVSAETLAMLRLALELAERSGGAFDPTWAGLAPAWDLKADPPRVPSPEELAAARALVGWEGLRLDAEAGTAFLEREGMAVGLGGVAKGGIVDAAGAAMLAAGAEAVLIDAGGDLLALGRKSATHPWRAGIQDPRAPDDLLGSVELEDEALASSAGYARFVEIDGKRYHHVLDPRTGWPSEGALGVSVIAPSAALADGLATALFVLGPKEGLALAATFPGVDALIVDNAGTLHMSPGFEQRLQR